MCRKGSSLTTAEVRSTLRSGWQHQHEPADSYVDIKKPKNIIYKDKKLTHQLPFNKTVHSPSTHHSAPFGFTCNLEFIKTGSAKLSVSMQHLFHHDFGMGAKSLSYTVQFRASYLVMLCSRRELHKGLKCASLYPRELDVWKFFNVDSCSSMSL